MPNEIIQRFIIVNELNKKLEIITLEFCLKSLYKKPNFLMFHSNLEDSRLNGTLNEHKNVPFPFERASDRRSCSILVRTGGKH
jgi:hypothetical protein